MPSSDHPHQEQPVLEAGAPLADARAAMILLHGRGASAQGMLALADELGVPDVAYRAPQAARRSWYPQSFTAPIEENEPDLSAALRVIDDLIDQLCETNVTEEQIVLLGFSQGACLATEYAARHPQRYGGVVGLSGGLIGPEDTTFDYDGTLDGTPVFLGCSDQDPYIPLERVEETAEVFRHLGAKVTKRIYESMGHTTNEDELAHVRTLLKKNIDPASAPDARDPDDA
ncbi:MAG TPA: alpha/beta fold hydrolase [Salinibacter sp.]|nr:alpha/beta fold hydrolase [Salinibacter sp.]